MQTLADSAVPVRGGGACRRLQWVQKSRVVPAPCPQLPGPGGTGTQEDKSKRRAGGA